jgi:lipoate-protein ligase A
METWRLLPYSVGRSDLHFARSDALLRHAASPTVWWHSTQEPTLILGAGQRHLDVSAAERAGVRIVRRSAGGTAVYAGPGVLGQDIFLPAGHSLALPDVVEAYRWLGEAWRDALQALGVTGELVSIHAARSQGRVDSDAAMVCFGSLSPYEVVVDRRKLVGLAQVRRSRGILLQAGIHLDFDPVALSRLLPASEPARLATRLGEAAVGLNDVLREPVGIDSVIDAVNSSIQERAGVAIEGGAWSTEELAQT